MCTKFHCYVPTFFRIETMLPININVSYMMCCSMRIDIANLPGFSATARRRQRFGESALTPVFYQEHF